MLMDISVIILLTGPIIAPLIAKVGLDPIHTAMIYMVILAVGLITPPVGMDLFVASGISAFWLIRSPERPSSSCSGCYS